MYIVTGYQVLGIVYFDQLSGARHTHISYQDNMITLMKTGILEFDNPDSTGVTKL